ncbi:hypothetical protein GT037_005447 [Alternaria burnsii]|uniref:Extracellular membrane protein CFEM domain-containing protein n=1 Tax=Alternaria burnsii TaxID=1187904 RepID=A0A8H7B517_9PLEO|nr:uncharacterized protein GT037_005447 [Alternaria burnsii]KAF7677235.1 hypothetical protein GT037_005447 [Alternaria burnsii]CAI9635576.1 unnamed protein product [Alternaria burnsii]
MFASTGQWLLFAHAFALGAVAHRDWWLQGLPKCWQDCLGNTEAGCGYRKCICQTSESSASYLPSAVACAVTNCDADDWALELVLGPLELYCDAIGCTIPAEVVDDAYDAVSSSYVPPSTTRAPPTTTVAAPKPTTTTSGSDDDDSDGFTSPVSTIITRTTTDGDGNTLQIVVPIVVNPTGISTGSIVTSTVAGASPTSAVSLRSETAQPSAPAPTAGASPTASPPPSATGSGSGSDEPDPPANGDGSPFVNMQAGAERWAVSIPLMAMGAFAVLWMRL